MSSRIIISYTSSVFNFLKDLHTIFFSYWLHQLPSIQPWTKIPLSPHSCWHLMIGKFGDRLSGQMCCASPCAAMGLALLSTPYLERSSLNTVGPRGRWTEAWVKKLDSGKWRLPGLHPPGKQEAHVDTCNQVIFTHNVTPLPVGRTQSM